MEEHGKHTPVEPSTWRPGWWEAAFVRTRNASERRGHPRGMNAMLIIVAYDIADPKRLRRVADCCKNYGIRIQYSIFECRLEADHLNTFWSEITQIIDPEEDRLVAYPLDARTARRVRTAGQMSCSEAVIAYVF